MKLIWTCVLTVLLSLLVASGCSERRAPETRGDAFTTQNVVVDRSSSQQSDREIQVSIDSDGRYTVEGQSCSVDLLEDTLGKLKGESGNSSVHILCGSNSQFKLVQQVIDAAARLQMWTIRLQTSLGQEPASLAGICAGPWDRPVLHVRVFPQRVTVNWADSSLALLDALLRDNPEKYVVFIRPQEGATVGQVYSAFRTCEANTVEFGLVEERHEDVNITCIALRLRRTTYEDAYISVPVTDAIMEQKDDGTLGMDFDAFVAEAIRLSKDPRVEWKVESELTEPHPTQQPKPDDRAAFDAHSAGPGQAEE